MAWINATVEFDGVLYLSHRRGIIFVVPYCSGLEVGDSFKADGSQFEVLTAVNLHDRSEVILMDVKEVKNDKSKTRRNADKSRKPSVESASDDGLSGEN
jgi:hypothetical protein